MVSNTHTEDDVHHAVTQVPERSHREHTTVARERDRGDDIIMLMTIVALLIALWLLGMLASYTMGGLLHILLIFAIIVIVARVLQRRRAV